MVSEKMALIDYHVTYCTEDGIEHKLLCSSSDRKILPDDFPDLNNNVKNSFMPWQCKDTQEDEKSLKVDLLSPLLSLNSIVCRSYLKKSERRSLGIKSPIDKTFIDKMKREQKSVKENSNYNCSLCGYKCKYETIYTNHLLSHGIENNVKEVVKREKALDKHKCSECRYTTTSKAMYNKHVIKSGHKILSCPDCCEKFGSSFDLHKHKLTHALGNEFVCPLCDYKGQKLIELKKHLLKHSEKRLFHCSKCEFASSKVYVLEKHMFSHKEKEDETPKGMCNLKIERKIRTNIIQDYDRRDLKLLYLFEY